MLNAKIKRSTSGSFGKYCTATIAFLNVGREHNDLIVARRHARMPLIAILRCNSRGRGRIYSPTHTFFGSSRHVTHLAYTWTCVCNEPEIKVRQHSREDIKVIYDPGRCYENLPFYFFFFTFYFLRTLDFAPSTLDMLPSTLDFVPSSDLISEVMYWDFRSQVRTNKLRLGRCPVQICTEIILDILII